MTKQLINEIITKVEGIGFRVRGVTFDLGNKSFLDQTGFFQGQYSFPNPTDPSRRVLMFPGMNFTNYIALGTVFPLKTPGGGIIFHIRKSQILIT